jgi:hypothetical protein
MDFNLGSKNNMGAIATIILIILLSQSKIYNFLMDTTLGRVFLVAFILALSSIHKVLGVILVLFVIIMFNQSSIGYLEGFTDNKIQQLNAIKDDKTNEKPKSKSNGREGFNMIDKEGTILKGKRSNEMPIFSNARNQTDDVEGSDKSIFKELYSSI